MRPEHTTRILRASALCLLGLSLAACASGGPGGRKPPPHDGGGPPHGGETPTGFAIKPIVLVLAELDANSDRVITLTEMENGLDTVWVEMDVDKTGTVTPIEYGAWSEAFLGDGTAHPTRIAFDTNLDGGITRAEFNARMQHEFSELDQNHDNQLTRNELIFRLPSQRMNRQAGPGGMGGRGMGNGGPPPGGGGGGRR